MNAKDKARAERTYEVLSFVSEKAHGESRWRIVEKGSGRVLDDAGGWGYKTKRNAHVGWSMLNRSGEKVKSDNMRRRSVWEWFKASETVINALDEGSFFAAREGVDFTPSDVGRILSELGIETEFKPREVFNAWRYGNPDREIGPSTEWESDGTVLQEMDVEMLDGLSVWDWLKGRNEIMDALARAEDGGVLGFDGVSRVLAEAGVECPFSIPDVLGAYLRGTPRRKD